MAKCMGLMGEDGKESIMPLTRTSNGDLGITAKTPPMNVTINNNAPGVDVQAKQNGSDLEVIVSKLASDIQRGVGPLPSAFEGRYAMRKQ